MITERSVASVMVEQSLYIIIIAREYNRIAHLKSEFNCRVEWHDTTRNIYILIDIHLLHECVWLRLSYRNEYIDHYLAKEKAGSVFVVIRRVNNKTTPA